MTKEQRQAIDNAINSFIAARKLGVEEFYLIGEVFDASNEFTVSELSNTKSQKTLIELVQEKNDWNKIDE